MIALFPDAYPDELLYSQLARYSVRAGYLGYTYAAEDLYARKTTRPDIDFLNRFTTDALRVLTRDADMEHIVREHTMFPYYARFLPLERRRRAFERLSRMQPNYRRDLSIPKSRNDRRCLRYCPVCAETDRKAYGETYWHRSHQMPGVNICPYHMCSLWDSTVLFGKTSPALLSAEESVPLTSQVRYSAVSVERQAAQYILAVFQADMDMTSDIAAGDFLHSRMEGTPYLSVRGEQRNMSLLHEEYQAYYREMPGVRDTELWELQKVFTNTRRTCLDVCLLALFLGVTGGDLVSMKLPKRSQPQRFDEQVTRLRQEGVGCREIALRLSVSPRTIRKKTGGCRPSVKAARNPKKSGIKSLDWDKLDAETLPLVKDAISKLLGEGNARPRRITVNAVEKLLGLPCKRIANMPACKAEIERYAEDMPSYWAREILWAAKEVLAHNKPFNWKHIRELTNMRRRDWEVCLPYLSRHTEDAALIDAIHNL